MNALQQLDAKLNKAKANAIYQKARYWKIRMDVIAYLGGRCECGESDVSKLEIHHDPPLLYSVKRNGISRGQRSGEARIREWKEILEGKHKSKLVCHDCHIKYEHNGNTCALKGEVR